MKKYKICILTQPMPNAEGTTVHITNFIKIIDPISDKITLLTGNFPKDVSLNTNVDIRSLKYYSKNKTFLSKIIVYVLFQLQMSYELAKVQKDMDFNIFHIGGMSLLLPMLLSKIFNKKVVLIVTGSGSKTAKQIYNKNLFSCGGFIFSNIIELLEKTNYYLSDRIVILSNCLVDEFGLSKYRHKIEFNHAIFIDTYNFKMKINVDERKNTVGYIGRISAEKGIRNFAQSIPLVSAKYNADFLIGGDGPLINEIKDELKNNNKVVFTGWIHHNVLPDYLNKLKILVIPSFTELFAAVAMEAMACGTPVLVNSVGAAPDIIKDGENGFLMENNSPECIAKNIERVLCNPNLEIISEKARKLVEMNYSYEAITENYKSILENL